MRIERWHVAALLGSLAAAVLGAWVLALLLAPDAKGGERVAVTTEVTTEAIPEATLDPIREAFYRRDSALDIEAGHQAMAEISREAARTLRGTALEDHLYEAALEYLEAASLENARAVLSEAGVASSEEAARSLTEGADNRGKAQMLALMEIEYLKDIGVLTESD